MSAQCDHDAHKFIQDEAQNYGIDWESVFTSLDMALKYQKLLFLPVVP